MGLRSEPKRNHADYLLGRWRNDTIMGCRTCLLFLHLPGVLFRLFANVQPGGSVLEKQYKRGDERCRNWMSKITMKMRPSAKNRATLILVVLNVQTIGTGCGEKDIGLTDDGQQRGGEKLPNKRRNENA